MRRIIIHNHLPTRDATVAVLRAYRKAQRIDPLGYLKGLKSLVVSPDTDKWNASYEAGKDQIKLRRKFEKKTFSDMVQTLLHEAGHRGQDADPETYKAFKAQGLGTKAQFLAMANKVHREDYAKNGIDNPDEEAFAESYARFALSMPMPEELRQFWEERTHR
jgi:hypothetical protein